MMMRDNSRLLRCHLEQFCGMRDLLFYTGVVLILENTVISDSDQYILNEESNHSAMRKATCKLRSSLRGLDRYILREEW